MQIVTSFLSSSSCSIWLYPSASTLCLNSFCFLYIYLFILPPSHLHSCSLVAMTSAAQVSSLYLSVHLSIHRPGGPWQRQRSHDDSAVEGVQQVYCRSLWPTNWACNWIQQSQKKWLNLQNRFTCLSRTFTICHNCVYSAVCGSVYLIHVGYVGSQVFGTVEQPIRPLHLNSFPHFRRTQVHTISALKIQENNGWSV